jgi:hypothetical protein
MKRLLLVALVSYALGRIGGLALDAWLGEARDRYAG